MNWCLLNYFSFHLRQINLIWHICPWFHGVSSKQYNCLKYINDYAIKAYFVSCFIFTECHRNNMTWLLAHVWEEHQVKNNMHSCTSKLHALNYNKRVGILHIQVPDTSHDYRLFSWLAIISRWGPYWVGDMPDVTIYICVLAFGFDWWSKARARWWRQGR